MTTKQLHQDSEGRKPGGNLLDQLYSSEFCNGFNALVHLAFTFYLIVAPMGKNNDFILFL